MAEHKYAQVLRWIADGKDVQARMLKAEYANFPGDFSMTSSESVLLGESGWEFRIKPRTIMIGDVECEAPVVLTSAEEVLDLPCPHYFFTMNGEVFSAEDRTEFAVLTISRNGFLYASKEAAIAARDATKKLLTQGAR